MIIPLVVELFSPSIVTTVAWHGALQLYALASSSPTLVLDIEERPSFSG